MTDEIIDLPSRLPLLVVSGVARIDPNELTAYSRAGFDLQYRYELSGVRDDDQVIAAVSRSWGVLAGTEIYNRRVFESLPELRAIARCGVGFDAIDLEAATDHGVAVITTPGTNDESVGEFAVGMIQALTVLHPDAPTPLTGQTVAVVGFGAIGRAVARRLQGFGCRILAVDPVLSVQEARGLRVEVSSLDDALARAEVVTVHAPLGRDTRALIGAAELGLMRSDAVLVNTARGGVVDERALTVALNERRIKGAALDVFEDEPLPADHPLRTTPGTLLSPHIAGMSLASVEAMLSAALTGLRDVAVGREVIRGAININFPVAGLTR